MADQTLRGSSLSTRSLASDEGIELSERKRVDYECPGCGSVTTVVFAAEAEEPLEWTCSSCGKPAALAGRKLPKTSVAGDDERTGRTPFDMLLERRTREELEVILEERLQYLRSRRGEEQLGA